MNVESWRGCQKLPWVTLEIIKVRPRLRRELTKLSRNFKHALTVDGNDTDAFVGIVWARRYSYTGGQDTYPTGIGLVAIDHDLGGQRRFT